MADWDLYVQQTQNYCLFPEPTAHILELEKTALMNKNFIPLDVAHDDICIILIVTSIANIHYQSRQYIHVSNRLPSVP